MDELMGRTSTEDRRKASLARWPGMGGSIWEDLWPPSTERSTIAPPMICAVSVPLPISFSAYG